MKLQVTIKSVYGRDLIYPACDIAKLFTALLKVKSFTENQLEQIKSIGYEIEVITETKKL